METVGKPKQRPSPPKLPVSKENNGSEVESTGVDVEAMQQNDILAYIQESASKDSDLDLF